MTDTGTGSNVTIYFISFFFTNKQKNNLYDTHIILNVFSCIKMDLFFFSIEIGRKKDH